MQGKIYEIPLDISSGVLTQQIREVVTEDMGTNTFRFKLVKDKHIPYDLSGTVVRMMVKTPSGARIQQECTIENAESGTVSLTLKQSLILERGSHIAELQIYDETTQSIRLTTPTFDYHVRQSLQNSESIVATDEYTILQEALADLAGINIVVANKADKSDVGDIEDLTTTDKTNLVQAINEVKSQSNEIVTQVELKANKLQENWIEPTLINGWEQLATLTPRYYKDEFGRVHLSGALSNGTISIPSFTLAEGYRPEKDANFTTSVGGTTVNDNAKITVKLNGEVVVQATPTTNAYLDSISFKAGA